MHNVYLQPEPTNNSTTMTGILDSEEEFVCSNMSKSTIETTGISTASSDGSCDSFSSSNSNFSGSEVRNSSPMCHYMDSNLSDSSTSLDYTAAKTNTIYDKVINSDNGYVPNNSDVQVTAPKTKIPHLARFKICVWCRKQNSNPYFQYCCKCFSYRKEYFEKRPYSKRKQIRHTREKGVLKDSQESSFGLSCEFVSQEEKFNLKDIKSSKTGVEDSDNLCNICLIKPKNGIFNHGKIGHVYCCYSCAKLLWKKSNKCPLCNTKIKFVTKMIYE